MKSLMLLVLGLLLGQGVWGQGVVWERRYSWPRRDMLTDAVSMGDGTVLSVGMRISITEDGSSFTAPTIALLRITETGDTLYLRNLPMYANYYTIRMCRLHSGKVYVAGTYTAYGDTAQWGVLGLVDPENGTLVWSVQMPGVGPFEAAPTINDLAEGPNGTILVAASSIDPLGQASNIGYLACFDSLGYTKWVKQIREHPTNTFCNHVEQTPDGNVFVSGMAGSRIWGAELTADSGREIRRATFYQSSNLIYFDNHSAWVLQAPRDRYVVAGMIQTNPSSYFLGVYQGWGGVKVWGSEKRGGIVPPRVNQDGSIIHQQQSAPSSLTRFRRDSSVAWQSPMSNPLGSEGAAYTAYAPLPDSSAIGVGVVYFRDSTYLDWYVSRITNMGIPYDPSPVVSVAKQLEVKPYAYPTPCRESLGFSGLRSPSKLELVDMQGRMVLTTAIMPERMADVAVLVPGLYQYRLTSSGRVYSGRVMKE